VSMKNEVGIVVCTGEQEWLFNIYLVISSSFDLGWM
jgi:hypothetical protein